MFIGKPKDPLEGIVLKVSVTFTF